MEMSKPQMVSFLQYLWPQFLFSNKNVSFVLHRTAEHKTEWPDWNACQ